MVTEYFSPDNAPDAVPLEDRLALTGPDDAGLMTCQFFAFNTIVSLQAFDNPSTCRDAFRDALRACRVFEREFSRTLPHSDISRLNNAGGRPVAIGAHTAELLREALRYCADSEGRFDITMGAAVRLWDFRKGIIPSQDQLREALAHVDWRGVRVWEQSAMQGAEELQDASELQTANEPRGASEPQTANEPQGVEGPTSPKGGRWFAQLDDPQAAVDLGGIAKGWIADRLVALIAERGLASFLVNLGGNVAACGEKPGGAPWRIGLQDPRDKHALVGAVPVRNASAVTSGVYERCFRRGGRLYHHILCPETGCPAETDAAGATAIAHRSIDAEGYSTTLLALGIERGCAFARKHPAILAAFFIDAEGHVIEA